MISAKARSIEKNVFATLVQRVGDIDDIVDQHLATSFKISDGAVTVKINHALLC